MPNTRVLSTDDPQAIAEAKQIIHRGGLIAFPTDTVYGVAADPFNPSAIQKLYTAKMRPQEKALPVLIGDFSHLTELVSYVSERARRIAQAFWPGALTIIFPKSAEVPKELSPFPTIGIRMPKLDFALTLLRETGPLAATSANISDEPNPTTADDVLAQLGGRIDLLLDGGPTPGSQASTILDATGAEIRILRQGSITLAEINALFEKE